MKISRRMVTAVAMLVVIISVCCWWRATRTSSADSDLSTTAAPLRVFLPESPTESSPLRFQEIARDVGLEFRYYGNPSPQHYMTEQNGGGCALFDFDGDGHLDIFLPNGSHFGRPSSTATHALCQRVAGQKYRNIAAMAHVAVTGFGMGCAAGDFDNDGFPDLFLAGYGQNRLWHNQGDGTYLETPLDAAAESRLWGTSAAFADLDGNGYLDLYVVNYVDYSPDDPPCFTQQTPAIQISCGPLGRTAQADVLYHNRGDGRFTDISQSAGIASVAGKGLGVSIADFDGDDRLDIYVACDTTENLLFHNQGGLQFEEVALQQGAAVGSDGLARSGMGIACGDYNHDGRFDLFVTNFQNEPNDLYDNLGSSGFETTNTARGLDPVTRPALGFGTVFADFDLDQSPDLFVTNGHVWDLTSLGLNYQFAMPPLLLHNQQGLRFHDVTRLAGAYFQQSWVGRAAAVGDLDNDGDADLVITHLLQPTAVLRNDSARAGQSIVLTLIGQHAARQPLGARVEVVIDGVQQTLRVAAGDSYQAAHDPRVIIPVGTARRVEKLTVHWPGQPPETWQDLAVSPRITLWEGGRSLAAD